MIKPKLDSREYETSGAYICTVDREQREKKQIGEFLLYTPQKYNNNHRTAHPQVGTIVKTYGNTEFKEGMRVYCKNLTFETENKEPKVYFQENGVDYYLAINEDVIFGIDEEDNLIPREGMLLCEPIEDKLIDTSLELLGSYVDYRRDVAKVLKTWRGCFEFEVGEYVLFEKNGDYHFTWNNKDYIASNHYFDDILGVIDTPEWRAEELRIHQKDHSTLTDKTL